MNGIEKLAEEGLPVTLAVSLHTPDDELRDTLVPINSRWKVKEVLEAADRYEARTGRRYSVEYALIRDINDQAWRADLLQVCLSDALWYEYEDVLSRLLSTGRWLRLQLSLS